MLKKLSRLIRFILIFMLVAIGVMCIFWVPNVADYITSFISGEEDFKYVILAICYITALPLFVVFVIAFRFPHAIDKERIFHKKTAKLIKIISVMIFVVCTAFSAEIIILACFGESVLAPALAFVACIGFTVAVMLFVLAKYVEVAAELKEEADHTL